MNKCTWSDILDTRVGKKLGNFSQKDLDSTLFSLGNKYLASTYSNYYN